MFIIHIHAYFSGYDPLTYSCVFDA